MASPIADTYELVLASCESGQILGTRRQCPAPDSPTIPM
eukprot:CAMPEP_0181182632 /NCGR_PEP_ID=MMETSP1096-20121128/7995_1 /TAXON_ID=156174 ORGANISM="Chrysochromulina ericina, Strain CCMP281" /NCGR_SAMPLE_ID=MMETSP1096 /ASSEMBLY_ACC=CAM_ASM_000453 /LENGTH=38 /DNA_ID= /DNA_START= /DNA_END= /DNA_ORIENTATION=